jgi:hypothetical protein
MLLYFASILIAHELLAVPSAVAAFPPAPQGITELQSKIDPGVIISYKQVRMLIPDGKAVTDQL